MWASPRSFLELCARPNESESAFQPFPRSYICTGKFERCGFRPGSCPDILPSLPFRPYVTLSSVPLVSVPDVHVEVGVGAGHLAINEPNQSWVLRWVPKIQKQVVCSCLLQRALCIAGTPKACNFL